MDGSIAQTYLTDVLHAVSQGLLVPDIILLLLFIGYALFCIGSIIAECFSERRHFKVVTPKFLAALMGAEEDEIPEVIMNSGLLKRQKKALLTVYDYRMLPGDALVALIRRLVSEEESRYDRIAGRNNMAARVSPMLGLMGTLIPLGPGIQALGQADTAALSSSLLVAFDTTVAGLVVAAVCLIVGKIRTNWYSNYMSALDSAMATMLQKIEDMRAEGKIVVQEPSDYAFLYENQSGTKESKKHASAKEGQDGEQKTEAAPAQNNAAQNAMPAAKAVQAAPQAGAPEAVAATAPAATQLGAQEGAAAAQGFSYQPQDGNAFPSFAQPVMPSEFPSASTGFTGLDASGQTTSFPTFEQYSEPFPTLDTAVPAYGAVADPAPTSRVAPPIEEVPMPAFLDALTAQVAPVPVAQGDVIDNGLASQEPVASDPARQPASGGWYQPRPRGGSGRGSSWGPSRTQGQSGQDETSAQ